MRHPLFYIGNGAAIAFASVTVLQLLLHYYRNPLLWVALITLHVAAIFSLSLSLLIYSRKLSPETTWLPAPFKF